MEALIGAFLACGGECAARVFMEHFLALQVVSPERLVELITSAARREHLQQKPVGQQQSAVRDKALRSPDFDVLERRIGYSFRDRSLLLQAFTHPSCPMANRVTYERCAFRHKILFSTVSILQSTSIFLLTAPNSHFFKNWYYA